VQRWRTVKPTPRPAVPAQHMYCKTFESGHIISISISIIIIIIIILLAQETATTI